MNKIPICDKCIYEATMDDINIYSLEAITREVNNQQYFRHITRIYDKCVCCNQRKLVVNFPKEDLGLVPVQWADIEIRPDFTNREKPCIKCIHRFINNKGREIRCGISVGCNNLTAHALVQARWSIMQLYYYRLIDV